MFSLSLVRESNRRVASKEFFSPSPEQSNRPIEECSNRLLETLSLDPKVKRSRPLRRCLSFGIRSVKKAEERKRKREWQRLKDSQTRPGTRRVPRLTVSSSNSSRDWVKCHSMSSIRVGFWQVQQLFNNEWCHCLPTDDSLLLLFQGKVSQ